MNIVFNKYLNSTKVVDLFCGIGGLTHGLIKEGFQVSAGYDIDPSCKYPYESNNESEFLCEDICNLNSSNLNKKFENSKIKVLVGCAPCQPFSTYSFKSKDKEKWRLLYEFSRLIKEVQPDIVSMENVPRLAKFDKEPVFPDFIKELEDNGYFVSYKIVNCANYGVPQFRKRLVLMASKFGFIDLIPETHDKINFETVRKAIEGLPKLRDGEFDKIDVLHNAAKLSEINLKRIRQSIQGGTWHDWDEELRLECHKKSSGKNYVSVYGRMSWDLPAPTMTTHCTGLGNGRFGHPEQDRAITLREAAILQSFPKNYKFIKKGDSFKKRTISKHIGNAVPVKLGQVIGRSIKVHFKRFL